MPPIWSVESDDPNLAAVLERLVDIKKGNTLVRGRVLAWGALSSHEARVVKTALEGPASGEWGVRWAEPLVQTSQGTRLPKRQLGARP